MLKDLIALSRPKHWTKNVFILMPVPFALAAGGTIDLVGFVLGFTGFCLVASAVYAFNDVRDAERDRAHPRKQFRPVASGRVSERAAVSWSLALLMLGTGLVALTGVKTCLLIVLLYAGINLFYCLGGKNIALLDVFMLSSGFVLRVLFGCGLLGVHASNWLLLCSTALALFLALAKRRSDLAQGLDDNHRPSLAGYSTEFLDQAMGIMAGMSIVAYSLYCMEAEVLLHGREFASLPFVLFGVLDYLRIAYVKGEERSPVDILLSSPGMLICGAGWVGAIVYSIGLL